MFCLGHLPLGLSSIDAVWFGLVFGSFISSFSTFPGGGGVGWVAEIKNTAKLSLGELGNIN